MRDSPTKAVTGRPSSDSEFSPLIGARVLSVAVPEGLRLDGGGLAIGYQHEGRPPATMYLAFNDLGLWVADLADVDR